MSFFISFGQNVSRSFQALAMYQLPALNNENKYLKIKIKRTILFRSEMNGKKYSMNMPSNA
jgi:hypothetical protein